MPNLGKYLPLIGCVFGNWHIDTLTGHHFWSLLPLPPQFNNNLKLRHTCLPQTCILLSIAGVPKPLQSCAHQMEPYSPVHSARVQISHILAPMLASNATPKGPPPQYLLPCRLHTP